MQKRDRAPIWFGILSVVLTIIGIAGVPDDLGTWRKWVESALHLINHDAIRYSIFLCGIVSFLLVFYRPSIRRQIATSFKLGSPVAVAYFTPPLTEHGWIVKTG